MHGLSDIAPAPGSSGTSKHPQRNDAFFDDFTRGYEKRAAFRIGDLIRAEGF